MSKFEWCPLQKRPDYLSGLGTSTWHTLVHVQEKLYTIMHWPLHYWSYTASKHMEETSLLDTGLFSHISRKLQAISTKAGSGDVQMLCLSWIDTWFRRCPSAKRGLLRIVTFSELGTFRPRKKTTFLYKWIYYYEALSGHFRELATSSIQSIFAIKNHQKNQKVKLDSTQISSLIYYWFTLHTFLSFTLSLHVRQALQIESKKQLVTHWFVSITIHWLIVIGNWSRTSWSEHSYFHRELGERLHVVLII